MRVVLLVLVLVVEYSHQAVLVIPQKCAQSATTPLTLSGKSVVTLDISSNVSIYDDIVWQPLNSATDDISVTVTGSSNYASDITRFSASSSLSLTTLSVKIISTLSTASASGCDLRVHVVVAVPHTVHTICFKGNCYCNCAARGCGVNIHFAKTSNNIVDTLGYTGFGSARMDLGWSGIESQKGVYYWGNYDWLTSNLSRYGITPYYILDYSNSLYNGGLSPNTDDSRAAFARFAGNVTARFQGKHIIWEMWNEPNIAFWTPSPNVNDYIALAKATGNAIKAITPGEYYIGPTTAGVDKAFLTSCITSGLLSLWDAVSVHFYRGSNPETAYTDFSWLRSLIRQNKPASKPYIGILSGEWGYTTVQSTTDGRKVTEEAQAQYITREYLSNLASDVPISIWYDFHDDGTDPTDSEHNFGLYRNTYYPTKTPAYDIKPSGQAALTFFKYLRTLRFNKRILLTDPKVFVTLYSDSENPSSVVVVAWTTSSTPTSIQIPSSTPATFTVSNMYGNVTSSASAASGFVTVTVSQSPIYLIPTARNDFWALISGIRRLPVEIAGYGNLSVPVYVPNTLATAISVKIGSENAVTVNSGDTALSYQTFWSDIQSQLFVQVNVTIQIANQGSITLGALLGCDNPIIPNSAQISKNLLPILVGNPSGKAFSGSLQVSYNGGAAVNYPLSFAAGVFSTTINIAVTTAADLTTPYTVNTRVLDSKNVLAGVSSTKYQLADDLSKYATGSFPSTTYNLYVSGDTTTNLTSSLVIGSPSTGGPSAGISSFSFTYTVAKGWKYVMLMPKARASISGAVRSVGMWIYGDGSGDYARLRFYDSTGQTLQYDYGQMTWTGWKYVTAIVEGGNPGYWGGANDGILHYPISWDTYLVWDSTQTAHSGKIYFTSPTVFLAN